MVTKIRKRSGEVVLFDQNKITEAIWKAVKAVGGTDKEKPELNVTMNPSHISTLPKGLL